MKRGIAALVLSIGLSTTAFANDTAVTLKSDIVAGGPLVTLGDVFDNAGPAASRPIGPAPRAGARATFLPHVVQNAAQAAGLSWTAPTELRVIEVRGAAHAGAVSSSTPTPRDTAGAGIKRGDLVMVNYQAPGVRISARARALSDASVGQPIRLSSLQSNRTIDAIVLGPGRASANFNAIPAE